MATRRCGCSSRRSRRNSASLIIDTATFCTTGCFSCARPSSSSSTIVDETRYTMPPAPACPWCCWWWWLPLPRCGELESSWRPTVVVRDSSDEPPDEPLLASNSISCVAASSSLTSTGGGVGGGDLRDSCADVGVDVGLPPTRRRFADGGEVAEPEVAAVVALSTESWRLGRLRRVRAGEEVSSVPSIASDWRAAWREKEGRTAALSLSRSLLLLLFLRRRCCVTRPRSTTDEHEHDDLGAAAPALGYTTLVNHSHLSVPILREGRGSSLYRRLLARSSVFRSCVAW